MRRREYDAIVHLISEKGDFSAAAARLAPYLEEGNLDAHYLDLHFTSAPMSDNAFAQRRIEGLKALAQKGHARSMHALSVVYQQGDGDEPADRYKFLAYLAAAALSWDPRAQSDIKALLLRELGLEIA